MEMFYICLFSIFTDKTWSPTSCWLYPKGWKWSRRCELRGVRVEGVPWPIYRNLWVIKGQVPTLDHDWT